MIRRLAALFAVLVPVLLTVMLVISLNSVPTRGVFAQEAPTLPPVDAPPTFTPDANLATLPPPIDATEDPNAVTLSLEQSEALPILVAARNDLEVLANDRLGQGTRPGGWTGGANPNDPQLPILIRIDLEILADALLGANTRPDDWAGLVVSVPLAVARDIRHDLELLADAAIGASTLRPGGWQGDDPVYRCNRAAQNLAVVLDRVYGFELTLDFSQPTYCADLERQVNSFVEERIIQPSTANTAPAPDLSQPYQVESQFVVAFGDVNARTNLGVVPPSTGFTPLARSSSEFSNMMLIAGTDFQVFVDYTYTPVTAETFAALPPVADGQTVFCDADWCQ